MKERFLDVDCDSLSAANCVKTRATVEAHNFPSDYIPLTFDVIYKHQSPVNKE